MPATEQTSRNLKTLHVVFGVSSLALLLTTVWMLAADHNREAKNLQKTFNAIEAQHLEWRKTEQLTADYEDKSQRLKDSLETAQTKRAPEVGPTVQAFLTEADKKAAENGYDLEAVRNADKAWDEAETGAKGPGDKKPLRTQLLTAMQRVVDKATFIENEAQRKLKFTKADLDVANSTLAIEIDEGKPPEVLAQAQGKVDDLRKVVDDDLTPVYQTAKTHRLALQEELLALRKVEADVQKDIDKHQGDVKRLETAIAEKQPNAGKWFLELPIIDAFGGPLKPQQVWLPDLPWNNNFRNVARFDRCVTCHLGIDKTAPGSAVDPAYEHAHLMTIALATPKKEPAVEEYSKTPNERLRALYGLMLAQRGLLDPNDVTVEAVFIGGAAIASGLRAGDVIEKVNGVKILSSEDADNYLAKTVTWGKPLELTVRRGMPHPYASHPRLDLFVGSLSPHKVGEFGCTICHEGQGNATAFKWASHTPNDSAQADRWSRDHGWFNNHHWIYPMMPLRFEEANCLKCHHDVTELKPSSRFPDPPAPKLVAGFETIQDVGCFGCHEINGYDGPKKRRGPDLRVESNVFAAAAHVLADPKLQGDNLPPELAMVAELARETVAHPERTDVRKKLAELLVADFKRGDAANTDGGALKPILGQASHAMATQLGADDETPGKYPKVGPSLRYVASKNDPQFLYSWVSNPTSFRPTTKMPRFFGLHAHLVDEEKLDEQGKPVHDKDGKPVMVKSRGKADAERFEPIEVLAINKYLLSQSQPFKYVDFATTTADGKTIEAAGVDRGKAAFQTRGCLACHSHSDFPEIKQKQGPDLSGLGAKLTGDKGKRWLYSWLKQPSAYHARTVMPNLFLDPRTDYTFGPDGKPTSSVTSDPAADITAYLLSNKEVDPGNGQAPVAWKAEAIPSFNPADVDELLKLYLSGAFTKSETERVVKEGIPESMRTSVKGDEQLLITGGPPSEDAKLAYLGKKTIGRLGCAGCHDIPGFEDSKPIGTGLADWGRKEPSKLAFEQILRYLEDKSGHGAHGVQAGPPDLDEGFFMDAMAHHQREGFLWQKLREPRSYDYKKTENKSYIDRLRMPQFRLDDEQRESIMTFVLGLVAEPPPAKYLYQPNPRQQAVLEGRRVIEKYNCAGCHTLEQERWEIDYKPGTMQAPSAETEFSFLLPHYSPAEVEKSKKTDRRGLGHAVIHGLPLPKEDPEETSVYFKLWRPDLIDGQSWLANGDVQVDEALNPPNSPDRRKQNGGALANYLYPVNLANETKVNPGINKASVWGFGPPPLIGQGQKVQTQWLHDFLLEPYPIRPAVVLRMPKFHLTSAESRAIVNYFAAQDDVEFPYAFDSRTQSDYLSSKDMQYRMANGATGDAARDKRLNDAFALITDPQFCVKCHKVGDYTPAGRDVGLAPNLADVHRRFRPEYLRDWIANPARLLPYTAMPVNFGKTQLLGQNRFKGSSEQQVDAIVDLLLNYDNLMTSKTAITPLIPTAPPPGAAPPAGTPPTTGAAASTPPGTAPPAAGSTPPGATPPMPMPTSTPAPTAAPMPTATPTGPRPTPAATTPPGAPPTTPPTGPASPNPPAATPPGASTSPDTKP